MGGFLFGDHFPMLLRDLQAQFAQTYKDHETLAAKSGLTQEDHQRLDDSLASLKSLKAQIERAQEALRLAEWGQGSAGALPLAAAKTGRPEFEGWQEAGEEEGLLTPAQIKTIRSPEYKSAFREYLRAGGLMNTMKSESIKVLQEGNDSSGGFLVPEEILARVIAKEPAPTTVQARVTQFNTSSDALVVPKLRYDNNPSDDPNSWLFTSGMRITWTGEVPASSTVHRVTDPIWANVRIPVHTAMMSLPITNNMIEDAAFPLVSYLSGKFSETLMLTKENVIINGNGIGQPAGILMNPGGTGQPGVVLSGVAGSLGTNADKLIQVAGNLPPQYDDNGCWVFNKNSTMVALGQMKDAQGRYLWGSGYQDSGFIPSLKGRQILGYDCVLNQFMPNVGAANYPIIFGDLGAYALVNRLGFSIQVLRELYAETNQVLILGRARLGGQVIEDWKLQAFKSNNT